jgi:hypothetical protein
MCSWVKGGYRNVALAVDAISISNQMAKHRNTISVRCRVQNVASACNAGGSSSLHQRITATARLMRLLRCAAAHLKTSQRFLQHTSNTQHNTSRAPLQLHLHSLHATPRHTLHNHLSPAPHTVRHVHIGRRGGQSTARERHTGEHEAHSPTRRIFNENGAEGQQRLLPADFVTPRSLHKKLRLGLQELERALDLRAKLRGRPQLAVGDEGK